MTATEPTPEVARLKQLFALVAREEHHLFGVRERLFGHRPADGVSNAIGNAGRNRPSGVFRR